MSASPRLICFCLALVVFQMALISTAQTSYSGSPNQRHCADLDGHEEPCPTPVPNQPVRSDASTGKEASAPGILHYGSTYIPLDSWMYPVIERLAGQGVIKIAFFGLRPWTRVAVYQMLQGVDESGLDSFSATLVASLKAELRREEQLDLGQPSKAARIDKIYERTQSVSGKPLNASFNFGQTIADDFGRPYGQGWQQLVGFRNRAEAGRFALFVSGEYQHSPSIPGYSSSIAKVIAVQDSTPVQSYPGTGAGNTFRLLDTYVSMHLLGNDFSVGKQTYWWGPGDGSAMMLSNNAVPFYSLRINRTTPLRVPLLSRLLGPMRYDNFFGQLTEHNFPPRPFFWGQKISFRPSENLELGFSRDAVFAGEGVSPLTFGNFFHSFFSTTSGTCAGCSLRENPGARHGNFDFRYRIPGLRNWLTLYTDSLVHDDPSPLDAPRRAAVTPGIYLARFPGISKLDLHVEGGTTDTVTSRAKGGQFYYYQSIYKDGYTNKGYLLGSWLGREGTGGKAWATYWFSPKSFVQVGYKTLTVSPYFVPQGETQKAAYVNVRRSWQSGMTLQLFVQGERWAAPVLAPTPQVDITAQLQISYNSKNWTLVRH